MTFYSTVGKRTIDVLAASGLLILTAPVHALCAAAVRVSSGPPVYFVQERIGRDGQPFSLMKFRTMQVGTHERSGGYPTPAMVTPMGKVLRKTSLDEIPQLFNILKGDMSIVGPRPALRDQVDRYSQRQRGRLAVRPGLTGLAQVRYRNGATWSVRIESDLEYIAKLSFWRDAAITLRTVPAVLFGAGVQTGQTAEDVDDLGASSPGGLAP
ncbi:sugar transferase [Ornithinimicrobium pekingense]|uniref:Sugar transferase n=1 Tax=Ornithinimicrobium pekingense TaxID=384677 RepID=A0ABQ2FEB3_9MICO|nr:sugar transferase [Ornithinimicrobium pekingense]GGK79251.1 sugar transferase [Ornithinimicrobium pekingense]